MGSFGRQATLLPSKFEHGPDWPGPSPIGGACRGQRRETSHRREQETRAPCGRRGWWGEQDSNLRRLSQQIYSLSPLATREPPLLFHPAGGAPKGDRIRCVRRAPGLVDRVHAVGILCRPVRSRASRTASQSRRCMGTLPCRHRDRLDFEGARIGRRPKPTVRLDGSASMEPAAGLEPATC